MDAADSVSCGGLKGAEAAADPGSGDVPKPQLPQRGVLWKGVEAQVPVPVRVVVAARYTAGEPGHVCVSAEGKNTVFGLSLRYFIVVSLFYALLSSSAACKRNYTSHNANNFLFIF